MPGGLGAAPALARRFDSSRVVAVEHVGDPGEGGQIRGLDPVAQLLGLPRDWPLPCSYRGASQVSTFRDPHGAIVAYILTGGAMFDSQGKPLGYEEAFSWVAIDDEKAAFTVVSYLAGRAGGPT